KIVGFESIRLVVVNLMEVHRDVGRALVMGRGLDLLQPPPLGQVGNAGGHVRPMLAAIACYLDLAIVGTYPDDLGIDGRDGDRKDAVKGLSAAQVEFDWAATAQLLALIVACQIGADGRPVRPGVAGFE